MNKKFYISSLIIAIIAFALTRVIWPDPVGVEMPAANLIPFFIIVTIFESLAFGVGMTAIVMFYKKTKEHMLPFLSIIWLLISWWPHDNFHRVIGHDFGYLLLLEFGFHVTLMIAGYILLKFFFKQHLTSQEQSI